MVIKKSIFLFVALLFAFANVKAESPKWLRYSSISPDGKTIVFAYKGDIYRVAASGGVATPLTVNKSYEYLPVWSPDGKTLAFASDRYGNFDIFVMPSTGGKAKRLTFHSSNEQPSSFTADGSEILFSSHISDANTNAQFPSGVLPELYSVPLAGGRSKQILSTPALDAQLDKTGKKVLYHNIKGYENLWRKHHTSSVAHDICMYDLEKGENKILTTFNGEDRNPLFSDDEKKVFYLSEKSGSFNVWSFPLSNPAETKQLTKHENHPVRFLSISNSNLLCYSYHGDIYTLKEGGEPQKVEIQINIEIDGEETTFRNMTSGVTEMVVSRKGKEIVFVIRGDVFITSEDFATTKQITNTPEQERSVSFSPDGRAVLYASERNGSWNLYQTKIVDKDEKRFALSTLLKEEPILEIPAETFQPEFSPDGKEVAYLEERETLKVINLATKETRTILEGKYNYSYSDGDQWYQWSPDSKWFLVSYCPGSWINGEVGLIDASGKQEVTNLTNSGYSDNGGSWMMKGKAMIWFSDKQGMRNHGSWGSQSDIYAMFFTQKAFDEFRLSKEEYDILKKEKEKDKKKKEKDDDKKKSSKKNGESDDEKEDKIESVEIDLKNIEDRKARLTVNSSNISGAILTSDGTKLYYLSRFEDGYDLWLHKIKEKETKLVLKLKGSSRYLQFNKDESNLYLISNNQIVKIDTKTNKKKNISFKAGLYLNRAKEREAMFEHAWRQVKKKFYDKNLHGVDWDFYKKEYQQFLPHINNNYDFAEMMSELLGELNASHTGSGYRHSDPNGDQTASLGAFFDANHSGDGLKIKEIIDKGPLTKADSKIKAGVVIESIDGNKIEADKDYFGLLNHRAGKKTLLSLYNPDTKERWNEVVEPVSRGAESQLLYKRWVKQRKEETERLSGGKIGYIHVKSMNSSSYREAYSEIMGPNYHKEGIIVDTRFNGGGWLHDDLATLLNGKRYLDFYPNQQHFGSEPLNKWHKKSIVIVSESNYSDAHGFPISYRALGVGKIVGMPVPGTMTAVWWESLQDKSLYFGIPQLGVKNLKGEYLENKQFEPDYKVDNEYHTVIKGRDQQLEKAIEILLNE